MWAVREKQALRHSPTMRHAASLALPELLIRNTQVTVARFCILVRARARFAFAIHNESARRLLVVEVRLGCGARVRG